MARFFKNLPKRRKPIVDVDQIRQAVSNIEICDSRDIHPVAGNGVHHYHEVPFFGPICCKCGMDRNTGKQIASRHLKEVRKSYW